MYAETILVDGAQSGAYMATSATEKAHVVETDAKGLVMCR